MTALNLNNINNGMEFNLYGKEKKNDSVHEHNC